MRMEVQSQAAAADKQRLLCCSSCRVVLGPAALAGDLDIGCVHIRCCTSPRKDEALVGTL